MEAFVSAALIMAGCILAVPTSILLFEIVAAIALPSRETHQSSSVRKRLAIVIPAHDEGSGILPTLSDVKMQLQSGDRLLVVADNCTDETAKIASMAGAEVTERNDPARRGKGYALEFGVRSLDSDPPDIVIVVDADCRLAEGALNQLALSCASTFQPIQALYLMKAPVGSSVNYQVAEFAWRVKNWVRPLGLSVLGLPCQLMGTGMAFPWEVIRQADLASGWMVEDLKLGLDLARAGHPPLFCPGALVTSTFAYSVEGSVTQRARWEHGHIRTILTSVAGLFYEAIARRNLGLLVLTLDLAVPPLSLLGLLLVGMLIIGGVGTVFGEGSAALLLSGVNLAVLLIATFLAWLRYGREVLSPATALLVPAYVGGKLGLYLRALSNKMDLRWIRTDRTKS